MEQQLANTGIPYTRFEAVLPTKQSISKKGEHYKTFKRNKFNEAKAFLGESHIPSNYHYGTLGCYLSHYYLLKEIAQSPFSNVLVLEDDCDLSKGKAISEIQDAFYDYVIPDDWDIVRSTWLSQKELKKINYCHPLSKKFKKTHINSLVLDIHNKYKHKNSRNPVISSIYGGTHFQLINQSSAQKIIDYLDSDVVLPIDAMYTTDAINVYHAKLEVSYVNMGSDIHSESKNKNCS
jgi:GR25 family glycosyltransferase involved in LPS biosynthesis